MEQRVLVRAHPAPAAAGRGPVEGEEGLKEVPHPGLAAEGLAAEGPAAEGPAAEESAEAPPGGWVAAYLVVPDKFVWWVVVWV